MPHFSLISGALIILLNLLITCSQVNADGISCFKCYASQPAYKETDLLCSQFDGSQRFQVYCPSSTLCMKKTVYYRTQTTVTSAVMRNCAPQKRTAPTYNEEERKWHTEEEVVKTAYEERCFTGEVRGSDPPEYCFCSYHLCNSTQSAKYLNLNLAYLAMLVLIFVNLTFMC